MDCGLGFTEAELQLIRVAITGGTIGVVTLALAFSAKLLKTWLDWRK